MSTFLDHVPHCNNVVNIIPFDWLLAEVSGRPPLKNLLGGGLKSALFLLVGQTTTDRVAAAFKALPPFEIISTNLSKEQEQKLKDEFEAAA